MGGQSILGHELKRDLPSEFGFHAASDIDLCQFLSFELWIFRKLPPLAREIGLLSVGLGADRNILSCRHGHGTSHEAGKTGNQNIAFCGSCCGHTKDQARGRDDPIVSSEYGCAQPADPLDEMCLPVKGVHRGCPSAISDLCPTRSEAQKVGQLTNERVGIASGPGNRDAARAADATSRTPTGRRREAPQPLLAEAY